MRKSPVAQAAIEEARRALAGATPVADFHRAVVDWANARDWRHFAARSNQFGFPSLTLVRESRLVFAELESQHSYVPNARCVWLDELAQVENVETHLWRPSDFDRIKEILR